MAHPLLTRLTLAITGAAVVVGCGGSDDTSSQGQTTPGSAGAGGGSAGAGGSTTAGAGGSTTAGAGGSTTAGAGGSTTAGAGGSTTAGSGGSTTAGSGGSTAGAGGSMAGAGGSTTAGSGGSTAGAGGSTTAGSGGSMAGAGGSTTAGSGGAAAGSGGATAVGCAAGGDCVKTAWCSTSTLAESYCECVDTGAYKCGTPPVQFSTITVCIAPNANSSCPPLGDSTLSTRIMAEYISSSCGAFAQTGPEAKTTTAGVPRCCYGVITDACVGRPLFVLESLRVAPVARRADWA